MGMAPGIPIRRQRSSRQDMTVLPAEPGQMIIFPKSWGSAVGEPQPTP